MSSNRFRVAVVGAGLISRSAHIPSIVRSEHAELTAVVDRDVSRARSLCDELGVKPAVFSELASLKDCCDAAIIATPNNTHFDLAAQCLESGLDVLVEKPLAVSTREAEELSCLASRYERVLMVGFCTRYLPAVSEMKRIVEDRAFGVVRRFVFQFGSTSGWAPVSNYFTSRTQTGGGAFVINGSHYLDRMLDFWGEPSSFSFEDDAEGGPEAYAVGRFDYTSPMHFSGEIRVSKRDDLANGTVIEFDRATLIHRESDINRLSMVIEGDSAARVWEHRTQSSKGMYDLQLSDFVSRSTGNVRSANDLTTSIAGVALTENLYTTRKLTQRLELESL